MLRSKKFNVLKHISINDLFDHQIENINVIKPIDNIEIKITKDYDLVKEITLEPYILKLKDILLIHIKDDLIKDFEFLYKKSRKYVFDIYETTHPDLKDDSDIKMYHIFCVSKKIGLDTDYMGFLKANDSDKKYYCLSLLYGPSIIVNRRFDITSDASKYQSKYKFLKTIGKGYVNITLRNFIKHVTNIANEYQKMLPPHYLKLN